MNVPDVDDPHAALPTEQTSPELAEFLQHQALQGGTGDIYGIPRAEWLQLTYPVRYMGNEFGAVHKPFAEQVTSLHLLHV